MNLLVEVELPCGHVVVVARLRIAPVRVGCPCLNQRSFVLRPGARELDWYDLSFDDFLRRG